MMCYSIQPRVWIFVKGYGSLSFAKNTGKNIGQNTSKNGSGKYSQKLLNHARKSATDAFRTASKRAIQKWAAAIGDLIGNKRANKVTKFSKNSKQNNSEIVTNGQDKEIPNEIYIFPEKGQEIINEMRIK